ncbi:MAG TPA: UrcA family protein [Phenylobacterium sp.]|jgi:UrcA family protein
MTNFAARIAGVATLALAALPAAALTTVAHAATHVPASVRIADLDLASADGRAAFSQRVDTAARKFCSNEASLDLKAGCAAGVRAELNEKVSGQVRLAAR